MYYIYIYIYLETSENLIIAFKKILSGNVWVELISKNLKGVWFNLSPFFGTESSRSSLCQAKYGWQCGC